MDNRDCFSSFHPVVNFLYFTTIISFSMFIMSPIYLVISLFGAVSYNIYLSGQKAAKLVFLLPIVLIAALINPLFNHEGITILTYFPSGNPLTLESIVYGISSSVMLASVILWFSAYTKVFTSDKFVYLFGKIIPSLSLVLSMTLRFVPMFLEQTKKVIEAQRFLGCDIYSGSVAKRVKSGATILSIVTTWCFENAIDTADSMKSRGYGLASRTAFSIYKLEERDKQAILWILFCVAYISSGFLSKIIFFRYFPVIKYAELSVFGLSFALCYLALSCTPIIIGIKSDYWWKKMKGVQNEKEL